MDGDEDDDDDGGDVERDDVCASQNSSSSGSVSFARTSNASFYQPVSEGVPVLENCI